MTPRVAPEKIVVLRKRRIAESVEKSLFFPISQARDSRETWCLITDDCILNYTDPEQERFGAFLFHLCSWISNSCSRFYRLRAQIRLATCVLYLIICAERIHSFLISICCPFWHETASFFPSRSPPMPSHSLMKTIQELYVHQYYRYSAAYYCV